MGQAPGLQFRGTRLDWVHSAIDPLLDYLCKASDIVKGIAKPFIEVGKKQCSWRMVLSPREIHWSINSWYLCEVLSVEFFEVPHRVDKVFFIGKKEKERKQLFFPKVRIVIPQSPPPPPPPSLSLSLSRFFSPLLCLWHLSDFLSFSL